MHKKLIIIKCTAPVATCTVVYLFKRGCKVSSTRSVSMQLAWIFLVFFVVGATEGEAAEERPQLKRVSKFQCCQLYH